MSPDPRTLRPGDRLWFKARYHPEYGAHAIVSRATPHEVEAVIVDLVTANGTHLEWPARLIRTRFMGWR